jgi:hypothetical protein
MVEKIGCASTQEPKIHVPIRKYGGENRAPRSQKFTSIFVPAILIAGLTKYILADLASHHSLGRKAHLVVPWTCGPSI